ncbi:hypothetical protein ABGV42_00685 [Paenibacillus pabuli]|uniref:hypothetical protein n=1 Tax=Paenibacillus pabuli TaxID=1472 RepID=UPI0032428B19
MHIDVIRDSMITAVEDISISEHFDKIVLLDIVENIVDYFRKGEHLPQFFEFWGDSWSAPGVALTYEPDSVALDIAHHYAYTKGVGHGYTEVLTMQPVDLERFLENFHEFIQVHVILL